MRKELAQLKVTLSRLNDMWSFTGRPFSHKVPLLLRLEPEDNCEALQYVVAAYACLAAHAGLAIEDGIVPDPTWDRLFCGVGQAALFDLPQQLKYFDKRRFDKSLQKIFAKGWQGDSLPSP